MSITRVLALSCLLAGLTAHRLHAANPVSQSPGKSIASPPRLMILTDIGGDPDDQQSLIRLLVYANEFDLEGFIASASGTPGELKQAVVRPDLIERTVRAYGEVQPNLALHDPRYPTAATLLSRIKSGNPQRGLTAIGEGNDTEGSRWINEVVAREDPRPINLAIWGGQTDLAQALWRARQDRDAAGFKAFAQRLRIYDIADQDGIQPWIQREFPGLFYILNRAKEGQDRREAVFRGMYLDGDLSLTSREWIDARVRVGHGALGALYPTRTWTAPNPHGALKEGDTPSWLYFLPNGLGDPAHPGWGGWGGRFEAGEAGVFRDAPDTLAGETHPRVGVWRWRPAFQADFQARMDWCVSAVSEVNHAPSAELRIRGSEATRPAVTALLPAESVALRVQAPTGHALQLDASASHDRDGNGLRFHWWIYQGPGFGTDGVTLVSADASVATLLLPADNQAREIHVVLEVLDDGQPALRTYRRVVVEVAPSP